MNIESLIGWESLLSDEEKIVRKTIKRFADEFCMPTISKNFEKEHFPEELIPKMAGLGLLGANLIGYGCAGMSSTEYGLACYELEACDSGLRSFVSVQTSLAMFAIYKFGNEDQKKKWLPKMAKGEIIGCFGLTEPGHGSDPGSMMTRASEKKDYWELNGSKTWITNAQIADIAIIWAKTENGKIRGFVVEKNTKGYESCEIKNKLSLRASLTGSIHLENAIVKKENALPFAEGLGSPLACLNNARFGVGFGALGSAQRCLEYAIDYSKNRKQFGKNIASKQLTQLKLADISTEIVKSSIMSLHFARLKDQGKLTTTQVSLMKRNNCRVALEAARQARSILGANGISSEYHVLRHALNAETTTTYEGTDEIHALIIGRALTDESAF